MANINLTDSSNIQVNQSGDNIELDFTSGGQVAQNTTNIGDLNNLNTANTDDLVSAVNTLVPTVLYSSSSGSNTTISLSDDVSNYQYLDIIYGWSSGNYGMSFSRVDVSSSYSINLSQIVYANNVCYFATSRWNATGSSIAIVGGEFWSIATNGTNSRNQSQTINIYKVLGYK